MLFAAQHGNRWRDPVQVGIVAERLNMVAMGYQERTRRLLVNALESDINLGRLQVERARLENAR